MKKRLFAFLVALTLLLPSFAFSATVESGPGSTEKSATELIAEAKELKRAKRYVDAAHLFLRAAKNSSASSSIRLRTEAATMFGWSGKYDHAKATYASIITEDPKNRGARLGLARIHSWTGEYDLAIKEYGAVLQDSPGNTSALVGRARVLSWKGDYESAIEGYGAIIKTNPENISALDGLARTLWWSGEHTESIEALDNILTLKPDNKEARRLKRRVSWDAGPTLSIKGARSSDSDSNEIESLKAIGYLNHNRVGKLHLTLSRYNVKRLSDKGRATVVKLKDSVRVSKKVKVSASVSAVNSESGSISNSYVTAGVRAEAKLARKLRGITSISRSPYLDTPQLIRNNIRVTSYSATAIRDFKRTTVSATAGYRDYSDSNTSYRIKGNVARTIIKEPDYTLTIGYIPEYRDFSKKTFSGYYNPGKVFSNDLYLNIKGFLKNDRLLYYATATAGMQNSTKSEFTGALRVGATYYVRENLSVEAEAKWSKSALETSTGYSSESYKAGLNYLF
ncbi:MAG: tetratricopeptide repeat protein [Proteobacteria bacterium]|nr:tetratricopeptide repeat protein [Pseudomonadota bacterium]